MCPPERAIKNPAGAGSGSALQHAASISPHLENVKWGFLTMSDQTVVEFKISPQTDDARFQILRAFYLASVTLDAG